MKQIKIFKETFIEGVKQGEGPSIDEKVNAWIKEENASVVNIRVDYLRSDAKRSQMGDIVYEQYTATVIYEVEDKIAKSFKKG